MVSLLHRVGMIVTRFEPGRVLEGNRYVPGKGSGETRTFKVGQALN
jgi:hypothetical protein